MTWVPHAITWLKGDSSAFPVGVTNQPCQEPFWESRCGEEQDGGTAHPFSRAHGLPSGLAHMSRGLRMAQEGNASNTRPLGPTPSHQTPTTASSSLGTPFWARRMESKALAAKSKGSCAKSSLETRDIIHVDTDHKQKEAEECPAGFPHL